MKNQLVKHINVNNIEAGEITGNLEIEEEKTAVTALETRLEKSLLSAYLYCSIPPLISQLAASQLVLIDGIIISRLKGTSGLAAITYCQVAQNFIQGFAQVISTGSISVLSALTGSSQEAKYRDLVPSLMVWLNFFMAFIIYALLLPTIKYIYALSGADGETLAYAMEYTNILIYFSPITLFYYSYTNALLAEGLSGWSMVSNILAAVFNAPISYILMKYANMGMSGAAIGSVISTGCAGLLSISLFFTSKTVTRIRPMIIFSEWRQSFKLLKKILSIGLGDGFSYFAYSFIMTLFNYFFTSVFPKDDKVDGFAAVGGIFKVYNVMNAVFLAFGSLGYLPIAGYFVGAKNTEKFKGITQLAVKFITILMILMSVLVISLSKYIGLLFSNNATFMKYFVNGSYLTFATLFLASNQYLLISLGQALGMEWQVLFSSFLCIVVYQPIFITLLYYTTHSFIGLMFSYIANDVLSIISCYLIFRNAIFNPEKYMDRHINGIAQEEITEVEMPIEVELSTQAEPELSVPANNTKE